MRQAMVLAKRIAEKMGEILGENCVGVYLHGSLAMNCYTPEKSDIDFLVVTEEEPTQEEKESIIRALLDFDREAPDKGLEMSVVLKRDTLAPKCPAPFSLHFSNGHKAEYLADLPGYTAGMQGLDPDLPAHFTVTRARGRGVLGAPIGEVFAPVPREVYLASVQSDLESAETDILQDPVYVILNLCRTAAYLADGTIRSKAEGGEWGVENLPEFAPLIREALTSYKTEAAFRGDGFDLVGFAKTMKGHGA